jgi:hypothetical protein
MRIDVACHGGCRLLRQGLRQYEREGAAGAGRAVQFDAAAQQCGQLS